MGHQEHLPRPEIGHLWDYMEVKSTQLLNLQRLQAIPKHLLEGPNCPCCCQKMSVVLFTAPL